MARRSRRGPARWPLIVLAIALVVGGVAAFLSRDDAEELADGPLIESPMDVDIESVDGDPAPIELARTPYSIEYRVEGFTADGGAVIDTERRWVRPPYESRVETIPGENPGEGDAVSFLQIAGFGYLQTGREDESPAVLAVEPSVAPGDARVDVSSLEWRGQQREVLDRTCQVYRSSAPIDVATPSDPEPDSWADVCVDDTGLVLHEEWVIGGDVFRRRIARAIDESPSLDTTRFEPTGEKPDGASGGLLVPVTDDSQPADVAHFTLPTAPDGFELTGRFGFTPARPQAQGVQLEPTRVAAIIDVYEDGDGGIVVVVNGGTNDLSDVVAAGEDAELVDLGALGEAELVRGLRQQEVRVGLDRGRFVRMWTTLPADDLVALARTLEPITRADSTVEPT